LTGLETRQQDISPQGTDWMRFLEKPHPAAKLTQNVTRAVLTLARFIGFSRSR